MGWTGHNPQLPYSYKILPLVYDEALSYWEQIVMLYGKVGEVIRKLNEMDVTWSAGDAATLEQAKAYADGIVAKLQVDFNNLVKHVENEIESMEGEMENYKLEVTEQLANMQTENNKVINELRLELADLWIAMNYLFYIQDEMFLNLANSLKEYIDKSVAATTGAKIRVINPISGSVTSLNQALDDLLEYMETIGSLTMAQYDSLLLTMEEYDSKEITMREYRLRGYFIFFRQLELSGLENYVESSLSALNERIDGVESKLYIPNPLDGNKTEYIGNVVLQLMGQDGSSPTMAEYSAWQWNMQEYKEKEWTMMEYRNASIIDFILSKIESKNGAGTLQGLLLDGKIALLFGKNTAQNVENRENVWYTINTNTFTDISNIVINSTAKQDSTNISLSLSENDEGISVNFLPSTATGEYNILISIVLNGR